MTNFCCCCPDEKNDTYTKNSPLETGGINNNGNITNEVITTQPSNEPMCEYERSTSHSNDGFEPGDDGPTDNNKKLDIGQLDSLYLLTSNDNETCQTDASYGSYQQSTNIIRCNRSISEDPRLELNQV